ncbi:hypothetical protein ACFL2R_03465 [Patescibacteria group bacterium]
MYFWKIDKLTADLAKTSLSEKESLKYLVAPIVFGLIMSLVPSGAENGWDVFSNIVFGAIIILGTIKMYKVNGGNNGKDFLQRYVAISWVVLVRWMALIMIPVLVFYGIAVYSLMIPSGATEAFDFMLFTLLNAIYFMLMISSMKDISMASKK